MATADSFSKVPYGLDRLADGESVDVPYARDGRGASARFVSPRGRLAALCQRLNARQDGCEYRLRSPVYLPKNPSVPHVRIVRIALPSTVSSEVGIGRARLYARDPEAYWFLSRYASVEVPEAQETQARADLGIAQAVEAAPEREAPTDDQLRARMEAIRRAKRDAGE